MPSTYLERQISLRVGADSYFQKLHFKNTEEVASFSSMDHAQDGRRDILASGSISVDLGGITTIKAIYIESSLALDIVLDGETHTIAPVDTGGKGVYYAEGAWTSLTLTNPSSSLSLEALWLLAGN